MLCWSGWIDWPAEPLLLSICQVHVVPDRSPRCNSMAPQYTCVSRSGATATYQSYQDWPVDKPGGSPIAVQVPPARRQRYPVGIWLPSGCGMNGAPVPKAYSFVKLAATT